MQTLTGFMVKQESAPEVENFFGENLFSTCEDVGMTSVVKYVPHIFGNMLICHWDTVSS